MRIDKLKRNVTAREVAQLAGVSQATVSYVLNGRRRGNARISDETRQRIMDAVTQLGYVPNDTARSLRKRRTERICMLTFRLGVPFYDRIVEDLQTVAGGYGYSVIVAVSGSPEMETQILEQLRRGLADGVVIPYHIDGARIKPLVDAGLSVVVTSNYVTPAGFDVVRTTEGATCAKAVRYLIDKGHRRIAFLGHHTNPDTPYERFESYRNTLAENNLPLESKYIRTGAETRKAAYDSVRELLQLEQRPTAIFAAADMAASSAILAINEYGLRVPDDIAVIGVGNIPEGEIILPRLTTVGRDPLDFTGVAELLFSRLRAETPLDGRELVLSWDLIVRGST